MLKVRADGRFPLHRLREFGSLTNQTCDGSFTPAVVPSPDQEEK